MNGGALREVDLAGCAYLDAGTDLLLRARSEDPMAGLWEAGDLQWWWKDEPFLASSRCTFWFDADGEAVACLVLAEQGHRTDGPGRIDAEVLWRPRRDAVVRARVLPAVVARLAAFPGATGLPVAITADERDPDLLRRLAAAGFRRVPDEDTVQLAQCPTAPPEPLPLPAGLRFDDDRSRPPDRPHHLAKRNGEQVAERLRECSLYRPDLDLCVRTAEGEVAAYCLCWLDPGNGVGLFEPVRTEDAHQRRGIGRALMVEGIRRLMANGATLIKVTRAATSESAKGLYEGVGFVPAFTKLPYAR